MTRTTQDRQWQIDGDPFMEEEGEELYAAIAEAVSLLRRIGGAVIIAANREEVAPDHYVTTSYAFKWSSYAPAKRLETDPLEAEPEPVAEPAIAA